MSTQQLLITAIVLIAATTPIMASPQRPSYAGGRPSGGLNQKDKYHQQQFDNNVTIADRFADLEANRLQPNASQRPPVGVQIVTPLPIYEPLPINTAVNFDNRIGGTEQNQAAPVAPTPPAVLPFDLRGDRDHYNYLSSLPEQQRPFWFLNYQAIQEHRNSTGQFAGAIASRGSFSG